MTTIVGVDPSMAATGLGVWRNDTVCSMTVRTPPTDGTVLRWRRIMRRIWSEIDGDPDTLIVLEVLPTSEMGTTRLLLERAGLIALIRYLADARGIPVAMVYPTTLKAYAVGDGRASKEVMLTRAREVILASCANDDEADALWCMDMALMWYRDGIETLAVKGKRYNSLSTVEWPLWTPKKGWTPS